MWAACKESDQVRHSCGFQLVLTKQQKGADLDLTGGQEDIEYCRGLKEQAAVISNKEGWQLFVERPGVWVSKH